MKLSRKVVWIFVIAFAMRALIPPGFMLVSSAAAAGGLQIVICTSQGLKLVSLDESGQPLEQGGDSNQTSHYGTCPYGPPPAAVIYDASLAVAVERVVARVSHAKQVVYTLGARLHELRFARGPPRRA